MRTKINNNLFNKFNLTLIYKTNIIAKKIYLIIIKMIVSQLMKVKIFKLIKEN